MAMFPEASINKGNSGSMKNLVVIEGEDAAPEAVRPVVAPFGVAVLGQHLD